MRNALRFLGVLLACATALAAEPNSINVKSLQPGLHATYSSSINEATLYRVDAKPALALGDSSPHPRLPAGPFNVVWVGVIQLRGEGPFLFDAFVGGEISVRIDDTVVLQGRGESNTAQLRSNAPFKPKTGRARISIEYRSIQGVPARLQLWWQGADFTREPLPEWLLKYSPEEAPITGQQEHSIATGRLAAGRFGCARCHAEAFPAVTDPPPGPSLTNVGDRLSRDGLFTFLKDPGKGRSVSHMPQLFKADRNGEIERWIIADYLSKMKSLAAPKEQPVAGDHRRGRRDFLRTGCTACHFAPDTPRSEQQDFDRIALEGLTDRLPAAYLNEFLQNPALRYPDGRHPLLPLSTESARDIPAFLLLWSKAHLAPAPPEQPVTADDISQAVRRLNSKDADSAAIELLRSKGCVACHDSLGDTQPLKIPIAASRTGGCLTGTGSPRYAFNEQDRKNLAAYMTVAASEKHPSPVEERRQLIHRLGCFRCHSTTDRPPPLESVSASIGGSNLETVPFLRTPRLNNPTIKYSSAYLLDAIRNGSTGVRHKGYTFRMARWGALAESVVQALAERDGDVVSNEPDVAKVLDPTLNGPGSTLIGFEGYSCVSCHIWNGKQLNDADPGAIGPDLTTVTQRIRREWFDRWMDEPARIHPGTPMPQIFFRGQPARINTVLDGDAARQKEAIWSNLSLGKNAPSPKPMPPVPVDIPPAGSPPLVAQIPIQLPGGKNVESICIVYGTHDLLLYDVGAQKLQGIYTGSQILRAVRGRVRTFAVSGTQQPSETASATSILDPKPQSVECVGYERLADGARILLRARFEARTIDGSETFRIAARKLTHVIQWTDMPPLTNSIDLPAAASPAETKPAMIPDAGPVDGVLERPGYRALVYPRPKTITGEDLIMPGAVAVHPVDGRVFVASMKMGEIFVLNDPAGDGKNARFDNYAGGLFQEAYSMLADKDGLYVLHRRNLTRIVETNGEATRFDRVLALPHSIAEAYDYGYGLVRDNADRFVYSYAPYASRKLPGSGSVIAVKPGEAPEELAFGFRNPVGWCADNNGDIFYTENQGEWIATSKLSHIVKGRYYGYPNPEQPEHKTKPPGKPTLWIPYAWARSTNGVTYNSSDAFGPFKGQFFIAELMYGGAIIRASLEKVNGEYQGACFPFWGKGLLGPVTLAFDPKGRLFVGGITEPGWMAQPDRGALFRIDFTGETPFEMHSINVRPQGFRLNFTMPVDVQTATAAAAYSIEHYRYEYSGAYGSPELDRTPLVIEKVELAPDRRSVELHTAALTKDRVYMINATGVKSDRGTSLVQPIGAYTLNEIPSVTK